MIKLFKIKPILNGGCDAVYETNTDKTHGQRGTDSTKTSIENENGKAAGAGHQDTWKIGIECY